MTYTTKPYVTQLMLWKIVKENELKKDNGVEEDEKEDEPEEDNVEEGETCPYKHNKD